MIIADLYKIMVQGGFGEIIFCVQYANVSFYTNVAGTPNTASEWVGFIRAVFYLRN